MLVIFKLGNSAFRKIPGSWKLEGLNQTSISKYANLQTHSAEIWTTIT